MVNAAPMFTEQRLREIDEEVIAAIRSGAYRGMPAVAIELPPPAAPVRRAAAASAAPRSAMATPPTASIAAAASPPTAPAAPAAPSAAPRRFGGGMQLHGINHDGRGGSVVITKIASR